LRARRVRAGRRIAALAGGAALKLHGAVFKIGRGAHQHFGIGWKLREFRLFPKAMRDPSDLRDLIRQIHFCHCTLHFPAEV
jgi:hypothetical protein